MPERSPKHRLSENAIDCSPIPAKKSRPDEPVGPETKESMIKRFCPERMHLVKVLRNDVRDKSIVLHVRFDDSVELDSIVLFKKCAFPNDPKKLQSAGVVRDVEPDRNDPHDSLPDVVDLPLPAFNEWKVDALMCNDAYHRLLVRAGLEHINDVDMTIIHPAEKHHFDRFVRGSHRVVHESPALYQNTIVPFLADKPRDLTWVQNILSGESEADCVLFNDPDPAFGFTLVRDYKWNGQFVGTLHYLALARDPKLTCLRDLRACHIPMLQTIAVEARNHITRKFQSSDSPLASDQILAFLHYPPTFYWLHVHFVHADSNDDSVRAGRAHLLEEVIRNLELDGEYYSQRTMTICLNEQSPMWQAVQRAQSVLSLP